MNKIITLFTYVLFAYLIIILILFIFQRSILYLPSREKIDKSYYSNSGLNFITLKTSDGLELKSLYKKPSQNKNTIIVFHGNAGHIGHRVKKFKPFSDLGYGLLLVEYRGYSENPGKPTEQGLYKDGYAALEFLDNNGIYPNKTIIYGESLGCGIAVKLSTLFNFKSTILEAPYTSISDVAQKHYSIIPAKLLILDNYDILSNIHKLKSPLLLIHGKKDKIINIKFGKKVFGLASKPKKNIYIDGAGHNNLYDFNLHKKILIYLKDFD